MPAPRALISALSASAVATIAITAPAHAKPTLGFADQKPAIFSDARLKDTGVKNARINVPWDVLSDPNTAPSVNAWLSAAKQNGIAPLITIDKSRRSAFVSKSPTNAQMATFIKKFKATYGVKSFSVWNEGNINRNAKLVGGWYIAAKKACPTCTILAGDIVDKDNAASYANKVIAEVKKKKGPKVTLFGLHNYVDVNNYTSKRTLAIAKKVKGANFWLTETGGVLARAPRAGSSKFAGTGEAHAEKATKYLLNTLINQKTLKSRIKKVYLYSFTSALKDVPSTPGGTWDSGMIGPDGKARLMLADIYKYQGRTATPGLPETIPSNEDAPPSPEPVG